MHTPKLELGPPLDREIYESQYSEATANLRIGKEGEILTEKCTGVSTDAILYVVRQGIEYRKLINCLDLTTSFRTSLATLTIHPHHFFISFLLPVYFEGALISAIVGPNRALIFKD